MIAGYNVKVDLIEVYKTLRRGVKYKRVSYDWITEKKDLNKCN